MNKMNDKGFLLAESLIVSTFVLTVLIYLFAQFSNLMTNHKKSYSYNSVENIYDLGSMADFLKSTGQDQTLKNELGNKSYIVLFKDNTCKNVSAASLNTCNSLASAMGLEFMIYTKSDMSDIKEYAKSNFMDTLIKQDMRDFIMKLDSINIEGMGRLIAKFTNGNFASVAINDETNSNSATIKYSFNDFNDMNIWNYFPSDSSNNILDSKARERFMINSYESGTFLNDITVTTLGGWEHVYIPLKTITNTRYTIYFDYQIKNDYNSFSEGRAIEVQALKNKPDNTDCRSLLTSTGAFRILNKEAMSNHDTESITFTASGATTYLSINFGMVADGQTVKMLIGNFRLIKDLSDKEKYGSQLSPNLNDYPFNGWNTERDGLGFNIVDNTVKYSKENQILYAIKGNGGQ